MKDFFAWLICLSFFGVLIFIQINAKEYPDERRTRLYEEDMKAKTFHGYSCTNDCSGHRAGYRWAEDNDIHNPDDCSGKSRSFIEGCEAYTEDNPSQESEFWIGDS